MLFIGTYPTFPPSLLPFSPFPLTHPFLPPSLSADETHLVLGAGRGDGAMDAANLLKPILTPPSLPPFLPPSLPIDEIHLVLGAGRGDGAMDAANLLKPMLARGELRCIGATTLKEYR